MSVDQHALRGVWSYPALLAALTLAGLIAALVSESLATSLLSWLGLGLPVWLILWHWPLRCWRPKSAK